jgi:hypothetical protein
MTRTEKIILYIRIYESEKVEQRKQERKNIDA